MRPAILLAILTLGSASGCALCCSPYDDDYVMYGSVTPRLDQQHGRSGSIFSDPAAGSPAVSDVASETILYEARGVEESYESSASPDENVESDTDLSFE